MHVIRNISKTSNGLDLDSYFRGTTWRVCHSEKAEKKGVAAWNFLYGKVSAICTDEEMYFYQRSLIVYFKCLKIVPLSLANLCSSVKVLGSMKWNSVI